MAKETVSRGKAAMGGGSKTKKSSGAKAHSMHIHRGKSGGFVVNHHPKEAGGPVDTHVIPDLQALQAHLSSQMGDQGPAPAPSPDPSQMQAPPQAGPPQAGPPGM